MASHWKSTPTYWCKFCSTYVRDTSLERKNHESSAKHQNNIQRSLRELHKTKEREDRDKQRAKDEVARLNGLVGGQKGGSGSDGIIGAKVVGAGGDGGRVYDAAARKAHAEQLAAMGVQLPDELKKEVTGVGAWETVSSRVIEEGENTSGPSMADILKQEGVKKEESKEGLVKGVHKRRPDEDEDALAEEEGRKRKAAWGSRLKTYPGKDVEEEGEEDLDSLLSGVTAKKQQQQPSLAEGEVTSDGPENGVKVEPITDDGDSKDEIKPEQGDAAGDGITAPPVPVFKKRKAKK